jgi:xanthine dehydrogenase/oxidase
MNFNLQSIISQITKSAEYDTKVKAMKSYNASNRWTKRGVALVPMKFGVYWQGDNQGALVNIYSDGSVTVSHSGIEMGQGIDTKVVQAIAMELSIPIELISVLPRSTAMVPNAKATGGSVASELCVKAALLASQQLNQRLQPSKDNCANGTWIQIVTDALQNGVNLGATGYVCPPASGLGPQQYNSYGCAIAEVHLDVLTGEYQILQADILEDCGVSMNPAVDIGQVEGAFVQGLGLHTTEEVVYEDNGTLTTNGTWEYKPPSVMDIPVRLNVTLLKNSANERGVLGHKAVGEPPLCMSCVIVFALQQAIAAARADSGVTGYFQLDSPCTVESVQSACLVNPSHFELLI